MLVVFVFVEIVYRLLAQQTLDVNEKCVFMVLTKFVN